MNFFFLALFAMLPWLQFNGQQAILFDIGEQRFTFWGLTLWPQDLTLLAWLFILSAFFIIFCHHFSWSSMVWLFVSPNCMDIYFYLV
jgi:polyferredoxin